MKTLNIKPFLFVLFIGLFLISGINCARGTESSDSFGKDGLDLARGAHDANAIPQQREKHRKIHRKGQSGDDQPVSNSRIGDDTLKLTPEQAETLGIETITAERVPLQNHLDAMGKVLEHPYRKAIVSYAFPARISEIHARIGDWVKPGDKLVTLQSEEVGIAKSDFYKASSDFDLAKINYERQKRLFDRGVGAQKDFLAAEAEYKVAEANLNAAEKKLHVLGFSEEAVEMIAETHQINPVITLYAPIAGKIIRNNAVLGAMIDQETEILTVMDPTILCSDAEIYEKDIARIREGQEVALNVPAYPEEKFKAKVCYISDVLNEETRTITVRSEVENNRFKLKPGMFANIQIFTSGSRDALMIPSGAILEIKGEKIVFIREGDTYRSKTIQAGTTADGMTEVLSGLQAGEEIVITGNIQLQAELKDKDISLGVIH